MISKLLLAPFFALFLGMLNQTLQAQPIATPAAERLKSLQEKRKMAANSTWKTGFRNVGPHVMSGRVVEVEVNPADPTEFYVAYATGGLWHTTNNGLSFTPIFDDEDVIGIGDVGVHWPSRTIWIGTGEANASRSTYSGVGVYKSTNNGKSWQYLGLPESHHIGKVMPHPTDTNIAWVAATGHLYTPNRERGVYKTTDGGRTWKQTLYVDENTGAIEMDLNPQNANEVYACLWYKTRRAWNFEESGSTSGIYKSNDGGNTWQQLNQPGSGLPTGSIFGRSGVVVHPAQPNIVYAIIDNQTKKAATPNRADSNSYTLDELKNLTKAQFAQLDTNRLDTFLKRNRLTPKYNAHQLKSMVANGKFAPTVLYDYAYVNTGFEGSPIGAEVYRSNDAGATWKKTNEKDLPNLYSTYGYFFGRMNVSPANPDKLVILGVPVLMSTDGGKSFTNIGKFNTHSDHHAIWINPRRDSHMILGNDGGVNITYDDGAHWFKANAPAVGQFYAISVDSARPYRVLGGLQDNGVWIGYTRRQPISEANYDTLQYKRLGGGDGMMALTDPRDNKTVYYGSQFGAYSRSHIDTGGYLSVRPQHELGEKPYRFNWLTPIVLSRHNPDVFYIGSNHFHRSLSKGSNLKTLSPDLTNGRPDGDVPYGTLTTISESPMQFGLIYTGTDDGNIHISRDGGYTFTKISNTLPKGLWVSRVVASKHQLGRVYATLNGYRNDHFTPYVYVSHNFGQSWQPIAANLPLEPVNVIVEDPVLENNLYVGTDGGLYVSKDGGKSYTLWQKGLPMAIPVHDIAIQERENEILLGTHGRSIYVADLNEAQGLEPKRQPTQRRRIELDD